MYRNNLRRESVMPQLNIFILKGNVRRLLELSSMTQQQFADIVGMSQGNVSKALNPENKKCFTIDQIFIISQYFGVSIDQLVGNDCANLCRGETGQIIPYACDKNFRRKQMQIR